MKRLTNKLNHRPKLVLRREALALLTPLQLSNAAGGVMVSGWPPMCVTFEPDLE